MNKVVFINDPFTGGHYAIQKENSKNAFRNPMQSCKSVVLRPDDVVVDIGAYVGEYALYASKFVKQVFAYEASPLTFEILKKNAKPNIEMINKAVVGDDSTKVALYLSKGIGATNSIAKKQNKSSLIVVDAINYKEAVKNATVVKIDVEGAEYDYEIIQPNLRAIILEFHPIAGANWKENANRIMKEIAMAGFKPLMIPKFRNGWDTNSAWVK
jgi:FkbM family methyltransferase